MTLFGVVHAALGKEYRVVALEASRPDNRFRAARFSLFSKMVNDALARKGACRIADLGGAFAYWRAFGSALLADPRLEIVLFNISNDHGEGDLPPTCGASVTFAVGDARGLTGVADKSFDIAHSNSVIEHVGRWTDMVAMANEVRRVASAHFVQTPYWGFPVDPHNRTPLFHWMPEQWRYRLVMTRALGFWSKAADVDGAMRLTQSNYLLDRRQFAALFPSSTIHSEIVFGLTKSLVAVGRDGETPRRRSNTRAMRI